MWNLCSSLDSASSSPASCSSYWSSTHHLYLCLAPGLAVSWSPISGCGWWGFQGQKVWWLPPAFARVSSSWCCCVVWQSPTLLACMALWSCVRSWLLAGLPSQCLVDSSWSQSDGRLVSVEAILWSAGRLSCTCCLLEWSLSLIALVICCLLSSSLESLHGGCLCVGRISWLPSPDCSIFRPCLSPLGIGRAGQLWSFRFQVLRFSWWSWHLLWKLTLVMVWPVVIYVIGHRLEGSLASQLVRLLVADSDLKVWTVLGCLSDRFAWFLRASVDSVSSSSCWCTPAQFLGPCLASWYSRRLLWWNFSGLVSACFSFFGLTLDLECSYSLSLESQVSD